MPANSLFLYCGDACSLLQELGDNTIQSVVTSPPYWGMRRYSNKKKEIGQEANFEDYLERLTDTFHVVRQKLKSDGTLWLNLGDTYTSGNRRYRAMDKKSKNRGMDSRPRTPNGLKPKDLVGIPWRVAFALRSEGWYLRQECIWSKPNAMPESVKDRPSRSHEHLFLFSKSKKYKFKKSVLVNNHHRSGNFNKSVWEINCRPSPNGYMATFPEELVKPCIESSSSKGDLILDPFCGSGTVGAVALQLERSFVGIELVKRFASRTKAKLEKLVEQ